MGVFQYNGGIARGPLELSVTWFAALYMEDGCPLGRP